MSYQAIWSRWHARTVVDVFVVKVETSALFSIGSTSSVTSLRRSQSIEPLTASSARRILR